MNSHLMVIENKNLNDSHLIDLVEFIDFMSAIAVCISLLPSSPLAHSITLGIISESK